MIDMYIKEQNNCIDFEIDKTNNDIKSIDSFESSLLVALFANRNRDVILNDGEGSELFKLEQSKITTDNLNMYRFYANEAQAYLYDENKIIDNKTDVRLNNNGFKLDIELTTINKEEVVKYEYKL